MMLKRDWEAKNASDPEKVLDTIIPAGTHEVELIPNPLGYVGSWVVLKGTKIGASEWSWQQWRPDQTYDDPNLPSYGKVIDWNEYEVVITS
jgi:hypothetical protein